PSHIASLFLAESCVFATIGGVLGYLLGQVLSVAAAHTGVLSGLTLNYSSSSVVMAMLLVMAVVVMSTLYPAYKASRLASPSTERTWSLPASVGDDLRLPLPFMVEERDATGLLAFIGQYLGAHREAGVGKFVAGSVAYDPQSAPLRLKAEIWMAPYDLGVSQEMVLTAGQADADGVCALALELVRKSGEPRSWQRTNFIFLDSLRKQFLRWRTVPVARREDYAREWAPTGAAGCGPQASG
ncbi:MAG TPA: hypothetical protein VM487_15060, partial [Phycisphaerae bacterium]|nr:hypothetical protein [Phycisphaerae bacterium]